MTKVSKRTLLIGAGAVALVGAAGFAILGQPAAASVATGAAAPAFSVQDASEVTRTLAEFAGRTLVLEWTNSGCPYVRKHYDSGSMQALQREATESGVVWLQVISSAPRQQGHLDGASALARVRSDNAHPTATLLDSSGAMGHLYGARNTPHMFIVGADGRLLYQGAIDNHPSARPATLEGARNYVREALADIAAGRPVAVAETTPYGCSVKYG